MTILLEEDFEGGGTSVWASYNGGALTPTDDPTDGWIGVITALQGGSTKTSGGVSSSPEAGVETRFSVHIKGPESNDMNISFLSADLQNGFIIESGFEHGQIGVAAAYQLTNGVKTYLGSHGRGSVDDDPDFWWGLRGALLQRDGEQKFGVYFFIPGGGHAPNYYTHTLIGQTLDTIALTGTSLARFDNVLVETTGEVIPPDEGKYKVNIHDTNGPHLSLQSGGVAAIEGANASLAIDAPHNLLLQGVGLPPGSPDGVQKIYMPVTDNNPDEGPNTRWLGYVVFRENEPLSVTTGFYS